MQTRAGLNLLVNNKMQTITSYLIRLAKFRSEKNTKVVDMSIRKQPPNSLALLMGDKARTAKVESDLAEFPSFINSNKIK